MIKLEVMCPICGMILPTEAATFIDEHIMESIRTLVLTRHFWANHRPTVFPGAHT